MYGKDDERVECKAYLSSGTRKRKRYPERRAGLGYLAIVNSNARPRCV